MSGGGTSVMVITAGYQPFEVVFISVIDLTGPVQTIDCPKGDDIIPTATS